MAMTTLRSPEVITQIVPSRDEPGRTVQENEAAHGHAVDSHRVVDPSTIALLEAVVSVESDCLGRSSCRNPTLPRFTAVTASYTTSRDTTHFRAEDFLDD